jgi:hypothetical protein
MSVLMPPAADFSSVFALLRIVADPKQAQELLEKLDAKIKETREAEEKARAALKQANELIERNERQSAELSAKEAELDRRAGDLDERAAVVAQRDQKLAAFRRELERHGATA